MIVKVVTDQGSILIDGEYGNIVAINGNWDSHKIPRQFNVTEYRSHYEVENLPQTVDIRDIGYWYNDESYSPPPDAFRNRTVEGQSQEGNHA